MPLCYTCQNEITFDKNIRSTTGKQIPLWPDKLDAHGHDEDGKPIRKELPPQYQQSSSSPAQQEYQQRIQNKLAETTAETETGTGGAGAGGSYLDTKRIRVMLEELTKKVDDIQRKLEYNTQIDTNKLIGQLQQVHDVIAPFLNTQGTVASDLLKDNKQFKIDPSSINHAKKADEYLERQQQNNETKFVDETKQQHDFNIIDDSRIPDNQDEMLGSQYDNDDDDNNKGVIDEQ